MKWLFHWNGGVENMWVIIISATVIALVFVICDIFGSESQSDSVPEMMFDPDMQAQISRELLYRTLQYKVINREHRDHGFNEEVCYDVNGNKIFTFHQELNGAQLNNLRNNIGAVDQYNHCPYCNCKIDSTKTHCTSCGAPC